MIPLGYFLFAEMRLPPLSEFLRTVVVPGMAAGPIGREIQHCGAKIMADTRAGLDRLAWCAPRLDLANAARQSKPVRMRDEEGELVLGLDMRVRIPVEGSTDYLQFRFDPSPPPVRAYLDAASVTLACRVQAKDRLMAEAYFAEACATLAAGAAGIERILRQALDAEDGLLRRDFTRR